MNLNLQARVPQWHDCKHILPKDSEKVLVCRQPVVKLLCGSSITISQCRHTTVGPIWDCDQIAWRLPIGRLRRVTHWMPLVTHWVHVQGPQEPDLSRCPKCNGPADNGHDREVPPNPFFCTKCMAVPQEPVQDRLEQLRAFCKWERVNIPHPEGLPHVAEWAVREIDRLRAALAEPVEPDNGGKTGWPQGLLQDDCRGLSKWLASRPDARQRLREALAEQAQDTDCHAQGICQRSGYSLLGQHKPLSEVEIFKAYETGLGKKLPNMGASRAELIALTRIVERAHGIGGES